MSLSGPGLERSGRTGLMVSFSRSFAVVAAERVAAGKGEYGNRCRAIAV